MIEEILRKIGLTEEEVRIYLILLETGPLAVGILAKRIGTSRTSLYDILARLKEKGFVSETLKFGAKRFFAENPDRVNTLLEEQTNLLRKYQEDFKSLIPQLMQKAPVHLLGPRLRVYEGKEGAQHALRDFLLYRDMEIISFMPIKEMLGFLGGDFFYNLNVERIKRNIYIRTLWAKKHVVSFDQYPFMGGGEGFLREIRITPHDVDFDMGYWAYESKVVFLSSKKESTSFIVESPDLLQLLRAQFDVLWKMSPPLENHSEASQHFLEHEKLV